MSSTSRFTKKVLARLRAQLVLRGWTQLELARRLGCPPSTLSSWLRHAAPAPSDLAERIERLLDLPAGALLKASSNTRGEDNRG